GVRQAVGELGHGAAVRAVVEGIDIGAVVRSRPEPAAALVVAPGVAEDDRFGVRLPPAGADHHGNADPPLALLKQRPLLEVGQDRVAPAAHLLLGPQFWVADTPLV